MSVEVMRSVIEAAEGRVPVDTLFTNAQIVDVYGQRVAPGSVAVKDGVIVGVLYDGRDDAAGTYEAAEVVDCQGRYLAPGFIDGHLHIESSNIRPAEYARMAATRGTTTAIADSHEIANVAGLDGLRFMIEDGRRAPISIKYMMPSCVPALPDEQAGRAHVRHRAEGDLPLPAPDDAGQNARDHAAVDGESALPDLERVDGVVAVVAPLEDDVVQPRADDGQRDHPDEKVIERVRLDAAAAAVPRTVEHREDEAHGDDRAVPVKRVAEEGE